MSCKALAESENEKSNNDTVLPIAEISLKEKYFFRVPYAYYLADYIWPGFMISPQRLIQLKDMTFNCNDIIIASYPKSGTTWVSEIVSAILNDVDLDKLREERLDERVPWLELDVQLLWARFFFVWKCFFEGTPSHIRTHNPRVFFSHLPIELLPNDVLEGKCRVIYVLRNPKDNAVSYYHFHKMARFLGQQQKTTWDEFLSLYISGDLYCGSWFDHVMSYSKLARSMKDKILFVYYENMKKDFVSQVERICNFLNHPITEDQKTLLCKHCSFKSMKENKMTNRHGVWLFNQKISSFFRKGEIGDWRNYFSREQSDAFDRLYEQKMANISMHFSC